MNVEIKYVGSEMVSDKHRLQAAMIILWHVTRNKLGFLWDFRARKVDVASYLYGAFFCGGFCMWAANNNRLWPILLGFAFLILAKLCHSKIDLERDSGKIEPYAPPNVPSPAPNPDSLWHPKAD